MAEQRVNANGQTVEFNEKTDRWEPVKADSKPEEKTEDTSTPVPTEDEKLVMDEEVPPRRTRFSRGE